MPRVPTLRYFSINKNNYNLLLNALLVPSLGYREIFAHLFLPHVSSFKHRAFFAQSLLQPLLSNTEHFLHSVTVPTLNSCTLEYASSTYSKILLFRYFCAAMNQSLLLLFLGGYVVLCLCIETFFVGGMLCYF